MYKMAKVLVRAELISSHHPDPTSGYLKVSVVGMRGWLTFRKKEELINFAHGYEDVQKLLRSCICKPDTHH